MARHFEQAQHNKLERAAGHSHEGRCKRTRRFDKKQGGHEDGETAQSPAPDHQPEEGDVEEGNVAHDVGDATREEDDGGEKRDGENGRVVEDAIVGAGFFAVGLRIIGGGGVAGEDVTLWNKVGDEGAVGAEEHDGVERNEDGGEDSGHD